MACRRRGGSATQSMELGDRGLREENWTQTLAPDLGNISANAVGLDQLWVPGEIRVARTQGKKWELGVHLYHVYEVLGPVGKGLQP